MVEVNVGQCTLRQIYYFRQALGLGLVYQATKGIISLASLTKG
jgi:hypothetical protein